MISFFTRPKSGRKHRRRSSSGGASSGGGGKPSTGKSTSSRSAAIRPAPDRPVHLAPEIVLIPADWGARRWRFWLFALLSLLVAALGLRIAVDSAAQYLATRNPELSLWLKPNQSTALITLAGNQLEAATTPEERAAARALAERALIANPLDFRAIRIFGLVAAADGDKAQALALMQAGAARSRRDLQTEWWLAQNQSQPEDGEPSAADIADALQHIDNVLRVRPELAPSFQPLLTSMLTVPATRAALASRLAQSPPWRSRFLDQLDPTAAPDVPAGASAMFEQMKASGSPVTPAEISRYLFRLFTAQQEEKAYQDWVQFVLPEDRLEGLGYVYDGDFRYPLQPGPFEWTLRAGRGYAISLRDLAPGEPARRAVTVDFAGGRTPFEGVRQLLVLPAGKYRFTGSVTSGLSTIRGVQWTVVCSRSRKPVVETELFRGVAPWRNFSVDFTVPEDCPSQIFFLRLAARIPAEEEVSGRISFTNLAINRLAP